MTDAPKTNADLLLDLEAARIGWEHSDSQNEQLTRGRLQSARDAVLARMAQPSSVMEDEAHEVARMAVRLAIAEGGLSIDPESSVKNAVDQARWFLEVSREQVKADK